jgi:parallel beta-helix repeat protein
MNPIRSFIQTGTIAAAAFFLASNAYAVGWCPTSTDYKITCNQCSRELTCDVNGVSMIWIVGSGVTLDGKSHYINYPSTGIYVTGSYETIRYVNIESPSNEGIFMASSSADGSNSFLDHIYVHAAGTYGIRSGSSNSTTINASSVLNSAINGVATNGLGYTDIRNTIVQSSGSIGAYYLSGNNPFIYNNQFVNNGYAGLYLQNLSGAVISTNVISGNYDGLDLETGVTNASLKSNWGRYDAGTDCTDGTAGGVTYHSGNTWGTTWGGPGCNP